MSKTRDLPAYVYPRPSGYYWAIPTGCRPDLLVRTMALGNDRDAAIALAGRLALNEDVPPTRAFIRQRVEFKALDATSRLRALTEDESLRLEALMVDLGMI